MINSSKITSELRVSAHTGHQDARDLQALLYREIGISAVAAALFMSNEMDRAPVTLSQFSREHLEKLPPVLRNEKVA